VAAGFRRAMLSPSAPVPVEFRARTAAGDYRTLEATFTNLFELPSVEGMVINARDVTERAVAADALLHQALHDPLTDLPNRVLFLDRVDHALSRAGRHGAGIAVLFLDLDDFET